MRAILFAAVFCLSATAAMAQVTNPDATCADYLKAAAASGPTPKSGDATADKMTADMDAKMKAYCTANPKEKAMDAAMKVMSQ